ncbi:DUF3455 domain-containing protein [Sphaerotilus mobilis]|uniref:Uncharacterized protein DUF3455 n=1 Tax=Sphaerotilus mobilis TaxID=47994 RepID=A0A4Q7LMB7_9BURK|nr:uncharacterized protein DUF3455 [Sphaerotilus mobilis]
MQRTLTLIAATTATLLLGACGSMKPMADKMAMKPFDQAALPAAVQVPAGHQVVLETVGAGDITYECKAKADMSGHEWVFVGPMAVLKDRSGKAIGSYFGPPATWKANDGSAITGKQLAVAPAGTGNIPLQLVQANPAMGMGAMQGISHIQRVATMGGVAPAMACDAGAVGKKEVVKYQADYIFWAAKKM